MKKLRRYIFTTWTLSYLFTKRYLRSKTALFFSILFPLILLFVFGSLYGSSNNTTFKVTVINQSTTEFSNQFATGLAKEKVFKVTTGSSLSDAEKQLQNSEIDSIIELPSGFGAPGPGGYPTGQAVVLYDQTNATAGQTISSILDSSFAGVNAKLTQINPPLTVVSKSTATDGLTGFDYAFTGLIGFSLLGLGIFGPINTLPALKKSGALSRLRTTPIKVMQFIIAYAVSSLVSGVISIGIMFFVAVHFFHFKMNGSLLVFSLYAIIAAIMMFGFGMAVGGWANDEKQSAPLGNLISFPMMFLSGVFFPRFLMPEWLQSVTAYVPLTPAIDGLRMISTQGKTFVDLGPQLAIMGGWLLIIYTVALLVFRWE
jgi:ABC-2 type transport system permease protein